MSERALFIAPETAVSGVLAHALDADELALPFATEALESWREREATREKRIRIAVGFVAERDFAANALLGVDPEAWLAHAEDPIARWVFALGVAAARCADGGAIVAVIDRPAPLDCAGFAPESAAADAACALVRSLARSEGARGVRVNAVVTSARLAPTSPIAPPPALASFPGTLECEVAGAVRMLLADDARGITGQVIAADCGRTW